MQSRGGRGWDFEESGAGLDRKESKGTLVESGSGLDHKEPKGTLGPYGRY